MPDTIAKQTLTEEVLSRFKDCPDPRVKEIMLALVKHLHAFAREVRLTDGEWMAGIEFLTRTGRICDEMRQEFILLSDVLGLSMLVVEMNHGRVKEATEATVQGPFYVPGAPELPRGAMVEGNPPGDPCAVSGSVRDANGKPIAGALLDVWQAGDDGVYSNQDPTKPKYELRGKFRTAADGSYAFRTIVPRGYQIPTDGPVGDFMRAVKRPPWRPAHLHFMVSAPGYAPLTTHLFVRGAEHLHEDAVFGVKDSLIVDFKKRPDGAGYTLEHEFRLQPAG